MPGPNVGYATMSVIPSFAGAETALTKGLVAPAAIAGEKAGAAAGKGFAVSFTKFAVIGAAAVVAVGAVLLKIGSSFDEAYDHIRIKTGATGDAFKSLESSFKNVFASVPVSMGNAADAVATLNQGLGLTGKPLENLAKQVLELSRITKTDLSANVAITTKVFNLWGVAAEKQGPKLDELFRISQQTGIAFGDLAEQLAGSGTQFKAAGFTFDQTAALLGLLAKNGLSASDVIPALNRALATAAKAGKPAAQVFKETFEAIRNAPSDAAGAGIALDVLGAKAGPKFAALIREGKLSYEDFAKTVGTGGDTILGAAKATDDWKESLHVLANKGLVLLEPIATRVFKGMTTLLDGVSAGIDAISRGFQGQTGSTGFIGFLEKVGARAADFVKWWKENWPTIQAVVKTVFDAIVVAFNWLATVIFPWIREAAEKVVAWIRDHWPEIVKTFKDTLAEIQTIAHDTSVTIKGIIEGGQQTVDWFQVNWPKIQNAVKPLIVFFQTEVLPQLQKIWNAIKGDVEGMVLFFQDRWNGIKDAVHNALVIMGVAIAVTFGPIILFFQGAWDNIKGIVKNAVDYLVNTIHAGLEVIKGIIDVFSGILTLNWSKTWKGIQEIFGGVWEGIVNIVTLFVKNVREIIEGFLAGVWNVWVGIWSKIGPWIRDNVFTPITDAVSTFWFGIKTGFETGVNAVLGLWHGLQAAYNWLNTYVLDPITGAFKLFFAGIKLGFQTLVDGVQKVWDTLASVVKAPVNFVITQVYNNGIRSVWNFVADKIGLPTLAAISPLNTGGLVPGGGPDEDSVLTYLTPGEFVLRRNSVRQIPQKVLEAMNNDDPMKALGSLELNAGGYVNPMRGPYVHTPLEALQFAARFNGQPYRAFHQGPNGFDCSGFQSAITSYIFGQANPFSMQNRWSTPMMPRGGGFGFVPGLGPAGGYSIAIKRAGFQGGPTPIGHVIGTLFGVGVETSGGPGTRVPSPNNAANYGLGKEKFHLPNYGGTESAADILAAAKAAATGAISNVPVVPAIAAVAGDVANLAGKLRSVLGGLPNMAGGMDTGLIWPMAKKLGEGVIGFVGNKIKDAAVGLSGIPGLGEALKFFGFAGGGMVPGPAGVPRVIVAHGGEAVFNDAQQTAMWAALNGSAIARGAIPDVHVYIGERELTDIVRVEVREDGWRTTQKVLAGSRG